MTWEGVVTKYHEQYCKELGIDKRTEAYVQTRVLGMTFESISIMRRNSEGGVTKPDKGVASEGIPVPRIEIIV